MLEVVLIGAAAGLAALDLGIKGSAAAQLESEAATSMNPRRENFTGAEASSEPAWSEALRNL